MLIAMAQAVMVALMAMAPLHIMDTGGTHERVGFTLSRTSPVCTCFLRSSACSR